MIRDSASLSVMIEVIGHLNHRWMQMKREEFMALEESYRRSKRMPRCIKHQISRLQHAISSLSSDSDDREHETSSKVMKKPKIALLPTKRMLIGSKMTTEKSFSNSGRAHKSSSCNVSVMNMRDASRDLHDYNAKPLPDPMINYLERSSGSSLFGYLKLDGNDSKQSSNPDFLSRDDANALALTQPKIGPVEKCSGNGPSDLPDVSSGNGGKRSTSIASSSGDYPAMKDSHDLKQSKAGDMEDTPSKAGNLTSLHEDGKLPRFVSGVISTEFSNNGGMTHSVSPIEHGAESLSAVLSYVLPHFSELGNRSVPSVSAGSSYGLKTEPESRDPLSVQSHTESSIRSSNNLCPKSLTDMTTDLKQSASRNEAVLQNSADYHVNEDSMILMGNVLMCSFMFRSHDAVRCGARDECVIPGMLQARFSAGNKLQSIDFSYDALGFMQQLAKASGNDITAHIVPGSVEMALTPSSSEARVITMAQPPYLIMYVNEVWTRTTGYSLMDVEGKEYLRLLEGEGTIPEAKDRPGKPSQKLEEVAKGMPACSTNIHYGKDGHDFIEFVCSYPLANERDEITHILHVSQELPSSIRECEFF